MVTVVGAASLVSVAKVAVTMTNGGFGMLEGAV
jgi:hypothetical protein